MAQRLLVAALAFWASAAFGQDSKGPAPIAPNSPQGNELVLLETGDLPVILSAPHGGTKDVPGASPRKGEGLKKVPGGFVTGRDVNTDALTLKLAEALEAKTGKRPYLAVARFHRKFVDANRAPQEAYEQEAAKRVYDAYHAGLDKFAREVRKRFKSGLLLDLHGQSSDPTTIFRGTRNGKTVALLVERFGKKAHVGAESFFGLMKAQGLNGFPLEDDRERAGFTGGYIVGTYGSDGGYGIDAIQLEFGGDFRKPAAQADTAKKLAVAIEEFTKRYLPGADSPATKSPRAGAQP
ncbi:MAG TPA: hypothetical protein VNC50_02200 [Planctomycetia bacterium]|nr:hypothetical protein [Planctomycetia bacterium]